MPLSPSWQEICVRLVLTMMAAAIIGFNRGARGHAAGFRTTILVGLAASVAMILTNILLPVTGKTPESFAVMDRRRLHRRRRHFQEGRSGHRRHHGGNVVGCDGDWTLSGRGAACSWCCCDGTDRRHALDFEMGRFEHSARTSCHDGRPG